MDAVFQEKLLKLQKEVTLPPNYKNYTEAVLPERFTFYKAKIENFEVRDDDIWVASYPKSGTTWTQEMVWLLANNCDFEGAKQMLDARYGFIEMMGITLPGNQEIATMVPDPLDVLDSAIGRRFVKTHLPWELLPLQIRDGTKKPKIIYVMRNVKDVVVSFYHHNVLFKVDNFTLEEYFNYFITDNHMYAPYWKNILSFWNRRHLPNILFLKYEDMIQDLPAAIRKTASFLGTVVPDEEMENLVRHLSFPEMKKNTAVNMQTLVQIINEDVSDKTCFFRKGKSGGYKDELSEEMVRLLDVWSEMNIAGTDFQLNDIK